MKKVLLTERDFALLHDCYDNVALSVSQIRARHFNTCGKATALNRLSKLRKEGYLKSQRVGIVIYQGMPRKIGAVYQITRNAISNLKGRYPKESFREGPLQLNTSALPHDLLLTDVIAALRQRHSDKIITRGCLVPQMTDTKRIPDAVMLDPFGRANVAIELELTAKSNERYRDIILQYRLTNQFEKVVYIVADKNILAKIKCHILQGKPSPLLPEPSTGKFSFIYLHDLIGESHNAKVSANN